MGGVLRGSPFLLMAYADTDELARVLKIRTPTDAQSEAMDRVLDTAAGEIDAEIGFTLDDEGTQESPLSGWQLALVAEVNIERAVEHWQQQEAAFGLLGLGNELGTGAAHIARDTWDRHAHKLAPLKQSWGLA